MADAFIGRFIVESKENYDAFMKAVGVPEEYIAMSRDVKVITEIKKDGDGYVISRIRPQKTVTNKIVIGQETELDTIKGDKVKCKTTLNGGKLESRGDKYCVVMEMDGGKLKEHVTFNGHTMSRVSKKE